jgi:hypothetical protein
MMPDPINLRDAELTALRTRVAELECERDYLRLTLGFTMQYIILTRLQALTPAREADAYTRLLDTAGEALRWSAVAEREAA